MVDLNSQELLLISEALSNMAVKYACDATDEIYLQIMGSDWSETRLSKSTQAMTIITKIRRDLNEH